MRKSISLTAALARWFDESLSRLPDAVQKLVESNFLPLWKWDDLTPANRRTIARQLDAQHPTDLAHELTIDSDMRNGFKKVSVPRQNKLNAKRPRPSRQKVSDEEIVRMQSVLQAEGVKPRNQCPEAYRRISANLGTITISTRGFRKRWIRFKFHKKGT